VARAFVTGGSGFIGGRLIERLVADGNEVRALARSEGSGRKVAALGAEPVNGDLADRAALKAGAEGCEVTYHAAAKVGDWGPWPEFLRDTVEGTRNVIEASAAAGARRLVHVSSEAVLIAGEPLVNVDERKPRRPDSKAYYPRSKAMAEEIAVNASRDGFETVVVRPRFVWGAGDETLLPELIGMVKSGRFAWVGGGRHRTDVTHVDNVVHGLRLAAEKGDAGEIYFVTDDEPVVFREFVSAMLGTQGVDPPERSMPAALAGALAAGGETAWRLLRLKGAPPLTRFAYWVSSQECTIDISKAKQQLGYQPVLTRADGMEELRATAAEVP
jgi:nucleoside-diphosphate-sugar epimerase